MFVGKRNIYYLNNLYSTCYFEHTNTSSDLKQNKMILKSMSLETLKLPLGASLSILHLTEIHITFNIFSIVVLRCHCGSKLPVSIWLQSVF